MIDWSRSQDGINNDIEPQVPTQYFMLIAQMINTFRQLTYNSIIENLSNNVIANYTKSLTGKIN